MFLQTKTSVVPPSFSFLFSLHFYQRYQEYRFVYCFISWFTDFEEVCRLLLSCSTVSLYIFLSLLRLSSAVVKAKFNAVDQLRKALCGSSEPIASSWKFSESKTLLALSKQRGWDVRVMWYIWAMIEWPRKFSLKWTYEYWWFVVLKLFPRIASCCCVVKSAKIRSV